MVALLVTTEKSGVDKYSQEIASRLDAKRIETRRYLSLPEVYQLARLVSGQEDIVHLPNQDFARFALFTKNPFIVTVHDLARSCFRFSQETITERILLRIDIKCIRRATHIIATSENTKKDLVKYLNIPIDRITVIYNGVDHDIFKQYDDVKFFDEPYIIYAGSERPRKNLVRLFEAFARLKIEFPNLRLVKAGACGRSEKYRTETIRKLESLGITQDVVFIDHVTETELAQYYSSAALLAYPSLYEGFGLPPLEAMASSCPVVTSNTSSLPEVVGDAAITVNPYDTDSLAEAMRRVLTDNKLRDDMIRKGLEQSKKFSWEKTAEQTLEVYNQVEETRALELLDKR